MDAGIEPVWRACRDRPRRKKARPKPGFFDAEAAPIRR
jgi:hypothetical protein